ncbi:hypothetical protein DB30_06154 [Enhygromyxa salina]|uniref:Double zinc ribbon n=1 Tax=Enhygromyxa salina TaxID=215803 RepID=A0A0C2CZ92_9BACT|nr:zinc ribbon domain-containing protein [Enhygromyxa salina]KIG14965.1 hypothetical protein DB30_06154 [Enhygromyxa salina]
MREHGDAPEDEQEIQTVPEDEPVSPDSESFDSDSGMRRIEVGSVFCSECGTQNGASATICHSCGRLLDPLAQAQRSTAPVRKLHGVVVATVTGISVGAVLLAWMTGLSMHLEVADVMRVEGERLVRVEVLTSNADLSQVFGLALAFGLAGLVASIVFAGRYLREVVLGATAGVFAQFVLWLFMARAAGGHLRSDLWIAGDGFVLRGPAPILLTQLLLLMLFTAILFAFAGWIAQEQITGKATCVQCHSRYSLRPRPPVRCPKCDAEQDRDGVQWPWVMLVALGCSIAFALVVVFLREPLGFALECHGQMSKGCIDARGDSSFTIFVTAMTSRDFTFWAVDQWRYLGVTAPLMLGAPLLLTFLVKRGSRASAGALVPINWLLATFVVMIALGDLGGSDAGFIFLMRMQVLALFSWGAVGVVGVLIGDKLRYRKGSAYLDEIDDD